MLAISLVCGFVSLFGLCMWMRGFGCCFAFCGLEAMRVYLLTMVIVLISYPSWCDCQEYLALFEVSFRVELICCNGPVWLYPVYLFWVDMSCWMYWAVGVCCWPGCWRCTCPAGYILYSINLCFHMWWCMHVVDEWVVSMGLSSSARWVALTWSDGLGWCIEFWTSLGRKWAPPLHPFVMSNY